MGWVLDSFTFTASGPTTTLEFDTGDTPPTGWGQALDNVSVDAIASAVPEPGTMFMIGAGLIALAGLRRHS
jgi:hypothetical protein